MRIVDPENQSGFFWLPGNPDIRLPGSLAITNSGNVELEIIGNFDHSLLERINRIHGHIEKRGEVTLDDCFYEKSRSSGGVSKSCIHVNLLVSGALFEQDEAICFDSITFSIDGLDEWVSTTGFNVSHSVEEGSVNIAYQRPDEERFALEGGIDLVISHGWSIPGAPLLREAKITQTALLTLEASNRLPLKDFISVADKVRSFLCFCTDKTVSIKEISAKSTEYPDGERIPGLMKVVYRSDPFTEEPPKVECHKMILKFPQIRRTFSEIINAWLKAYEEIEPSMNLYFASQTGAHRYLEGRFLSMAQCLETYHRRASKETMMSPEEFEALVESLVNTCTAKHRNWLKDRLMHGNELTLRKRLKHIVKEFQEELGGKKETNEIIDRIVKTRNYFTHYSKELEGKAAKGKQLWSLCMKMEALFKLHLLTRLGISREKILEIKKENQSLQYKLKQDLTKGRRETD